MSIREFNVTIKLGNAEMQEPRHVAEALLEVASRLFERDALKLRDSFAVRDINGNQVGSATVDRIGVKGQAHSPNYDSATRKVSGVDARQALIEIGTMLGSRERWDTDSICEGIAATINDIGDLPKVSDQSDDDLDFWADVAEDLGWEHDREEPEFDPDADREDDEMDAREDED